MEVVDSGVVDYTFALGVATVLVNLLISALPVKLSDGVTRTLLAVGNLAAVLYVAYSAGALDLQHSSLVYLALALGVPAGHWLYKQQPTSAPAVHAPVARSAGQQTAQAAQVSAVVAEATQGAQQALSALQSK